MAVYTEICISNCITLNLNHYANSQPVTPHKIKHQIWNSISTTIVTGMAMDIATTLSIKK